MVKQVLSRMCGKLYMKINNYNSEMNHIELGLLVSPRPKWMVLDWLSNIPAVIDVAQRILSPDLYDALEPQAICQLIKALMNPDAQMFGWVFEFPDYFIKASSQSGCNVMMLPPFPQQVEYKDLAKACHIPGKHPGIARISGMVQDLCQLGLPETFLSPPGWRNRLAINPIPGKMHDLSTYPKFQDLLDTFELVVFPGGEHYTECLFASIHMQADAIAKRIKEAALEFGWTLEYLGEIKGSDYEDLYARPSRNF